MVLPVAGLVLVHHHVQHPVQPVLDVPVAPHDLAEALRAENRAQQIVAGLDRRLAPDLATGSDLADRLEPRPGMALLQPSNVAGEAGSTLLEAAMPGIGLVAGGERRSGVV